MTEDQFISTCIVPLLRQMGFQEVTLNHGIQEFGKDLLFSEFDRFGNKRHLAAQVKVGDISGTNSAQISDIVEHIFKAFEVRFQDLTTKENTWISEFYVITSGRFTSNAKEVLLNTNRLQAFGNRFHLLDGARLDELDGRVQQRMKESLQSLHREIQRNIAICDSLIAKVEVAHSVLRSAEESAGLEPGALPSGRFLTSAVAQFVDYSAAIGRDDHLSRLAEQTQLEMASHDLVLLSLPVMNQMVGPAAQVQMLRDRLPTTLGQLKELSSLVEASLRYMT